MKFFDTVLSSVIIVLLIIGIHQIMVAGFAQSYWIFMVMMMLIFVYQIRKNNKLKSTQVDETKEGPVNRGKGKNRKKTLKMP